MSNDNRPSKLREAVGEPNAQNTEAKPMLGISLLCRASSAETTRKLGGH
jgi:hypothetical protein